MRNKHTVALLFAALLLAVACFAAKQFQMPPIQQARSYPAHDEHPQEKVTVAADPYDLAPKTDIFTVPYLRHEVLPVFLVISNDSDQPISLMSMKVQLVTARRSKLEPLDSDDMMRRVGGPSQVGRSSPPRPSPLPIPLPGSGGRQQTRRGQAYEEIEAAMFQARAVEAHGKQAGFVFFDVRDIAQPLHGGRLFVSGVKTGEGQELWFFEIPMEKYLTGGK